MWGARRSTDIVILDHAYGKYDDRYYGGAYSARLRSVAQKYGAMYIGLNDLLGRGGWDALNALGYWSGGAANPGVTGTDGIHPSDSGHQLIADTVLPLISS